ncbi:MAG: hypothetical protein IIU35_00935 [Neisseriaceae bacterium]|nr:hypothetical protein [Neisseriaceae bacterium]
MKIGRGFVSEKGIIPQLAVSSEQWRVFSQSGCHAVHSTARNTHSRKRLNR